MYLSREFHLARSSGAIYANDGSNNFTRLDDSGLWDGLPGDNAMRRNGYNGFSFARNARDAIAQVHAFRNPLDTEEIY